MNDMNNMNEKNALEQARDDIDRIDGEMARLFEERMECVSVIAGYKKEKGLPVRDAARERELLRKNLTFLRNRTLVPYYVPFLKTVTELSCARQEELLK